MVGDRAGVDLDDRGEQRRPPLAFPDERSGEDRAAAEEPEERVELPCAGVTPLASMSRTRPCNAAAGSPAAASAAVSSSADAAGRRSSTARSASASTPVSAMP
jgi:hypothetical protein